jgi:hypothetical protein
MYRGSGFLLHKDFQVHTRVVQELRRSRYDRLLGYRPVSAGTSAEAIREILALVEVVRSAYDGRYRTMRGRVRRIRVSNTLATKIIMGTIGCIPAFDALVLEGMRLERLPHSVLNQRTLEALFAWYLSREPEFRSIQNRIAESGVRYPPMKLVDMYLWERGKRSLGSSSGQN